MLPSEIHAPLSKMQIRWKTYDADVAGWRVVAIEIVTAGIVFTYGEHFKGWGWINVDAIPLPGASISNIDLETIDPVIRDMLEKVRDKVLSGAVPLTSETLFNMQQHDH